MSICVDDQMPPFSFITIFGTAKIHPYKQKRLVKSNAEAYGRRDSEKALVLVQIKPTRTIAEKHIDGWD